jgi:hypothetical protein
MLIVPGLAIQTGLSIYGFVMERINVQTILLQNFYLVESGDFFVTLLIQQTAFGFFSSMAQFGQLYNWFLSPTLFLASRRAPVSQRVFLKRENEFYEYGYNLAQIMTIVCISYVYSYHIPLIMFLGMVYLFSKLISESIWLIHIHKSEFENPGLLIRNACGKLFFSVGLLQLSTLLKFVGEDNHEAALVVLGVGILTIIAYAGFNRVFINPEVLSLEAVHPSKEEILNWQYAYTHPVEKENFAELDWHSSPRERGLYQGL